MKYSELIFSCAITAIAGGSVNAQSIDWLNPVDGDWNTASNWAGGNIPDNASEIAVLGLSGLYSVTSNSGRSVGGLMLTNPDASLRIGSVTYSLFGDVVNDGLVSINYDASIFNSAMNFQNSATISGTGVIRMIANSNTDDAQVNASSGTLTHASGHTIAGSGRLSGVMNNMGDIVADDPIGFGLELAGTMTQSAGGRVIADGGRVVLSNGSVTTGGDFVTLNGGEINVPSSLALIGDVHNTGAITINGGGSTLGISSSFENNGSIAINSDLSIFNAHLRFEQSASIDGTGSITMATPSADQNDAQIYTNGAVVGTIGSGQTVSGAGLIDGRSGGTIINNGTVIGNDPDYPLAMGGNHAAGSGEYRAEGDGVLGLNSGSVMSGVVFDSSGNGSVDVIGTNAQVNAVTNNGNMGVRGQGYFLLLIGDVTNNGTITINNNANLFNAHLRFDADTQINGVGTIAMQVASGDRGDAQLFTGPGFMGTIGSGQTVTGSGWIDGRDGGTLIINGEVVGIDMDDPLFVDGQIDATGGGVFRGDNGVVGLDSGLVLTGGTFESLGDGEVNKTNNGIATLSGVTNNGNMGIRGSSGFIDLNGDLTNNGTCTINSDLNIFNAHLRAINDVTIDGTGTVRLQIISNLDDAQVLTDDVFNMTIGASQTFAGSGRINAGGGGTIINDGTINGDDPLFELRMLGNHTGTGVYRSDDGLLGLGGGLMMDGGTFDSSGTGSVAKVDGGVATISNMTNTGQLNIWGSSGFIDLASDLTNNGEIWVNADGNIFNAHLRFTDSFEINGSGTIRMNAPSNSDDAQIIASDPTIGTLGSGQTIIGDGRLVGNIIVNGTLDPDGPTRAIIADNLSLSDSSQMIVDLGGPNAGDFDRVVLGAGDVMNLAGTLTVNVDPGYVPVFGDTWDIISGGTTTGTFDEVTTQDAPFGQVYRVIYAADRVYVILTCDGDLSGDGGIDFFDVSVFLGYFSGQDVRGDLNGDGQFNFFDVSLFLQVFGQGCDG